MSLSSSPPSSYSYDPSTPYTLPPYYSNLLFNSPPPPDLWPPQPSEKKKPKRRRKKHKSRQRWSNYIVQLIGLICLVVAAIKGFEPLMGVGFTLVMVGYKGESFSGKSGKIGRKKKKRPSGKSEKVKRDKGEEEIVETGKVLLEALECE